ncbi:MAG: cobalt transporter [Ruminococcaceae bacterium]|nr:cobalt transporter [Oscillospiraceae bacterium]
MHDHHDHHHHDHAHEHHHTHTHEHTHDGVTHSHPHDHAHVHEHGHPHEHEHLHEHGHEHHHHHDHGCAGECGSCGGCEHTPMEELLALMKYMASHNAAHANELAALAQQLQKAGNPMAYEQVMAAVSDFEKGNMRLQAVLASLEVK